jgi:hypoxanthine phosphoribosyltransferase
MFFSDLTKDISSKIDFIKASSYVETHSTGKLDIQFADFDKYRDLNVLLVDDICDTGITLNSLKDMLLRYGAKNVDTCVLLNKKTERKVVMEPTFYAFSIADEFVIGYGLDYNDNYRTLPYIAVL